MDVTTLVAGPAQAGARPQVHKPGIGFTAGAGSASAADAAAAGDGFASLVAVALDQLDGASSTSCHEARGDGALEDPAAEAGGDDAPSVDAGADAATLSLLIALTTPVAAPASMPQPDAAGQGSADPVAVDGDVAGSAVLAPAAATETHAAAPLPATSAATPAFGGVLTSAAAATEAPLGDAMPGAAAAPAPVPAPNAATATIETPAASADAVATGLQPANAPAPYTGPGAAMPPPATGTSRAGERAAAHPLRQALAALAAAAPAEAATTPATDPGATTAMPRTAPIAAPVASAPAAAAGSTGGHESRAAAVSRDGAGIVAPVATFGAASDAGSAGDGAPDEARDGFAGAASWAPFRGAESRLDQPAAVLASTGPTEIASGAPLPSMAGFGAGFGTTGDTMLRALDVPASARFEQTLSSVDPDVRNLQAMVRTVRLFTAGAGAHEARLTLEPEHLGHVALTVRVEQGSVSAHFRAETPAAQRWIETHQQELRAGLREQGLEVKDLVVTTDPDGRRERRQDAQPARPPRARRPQGADAPRFEVLV